MANYQYSLRIICLINLTLSLVSICHCVSYDDKQVYIVYMGDLQNENTPAIDLHKSMLKEVSIDSDDGSQTTDSLIYSYQRSFNGFAAKLTYEQMVKISGMEGVISVFPSETLQLHTTRSWDFIGLTQQVRRSRIESNLIVGVLDTGIWPESASFSDDGFAPPPKRWRGICQKSKDFACNNKIIGARYYYVDKHYGEGDILSPRDIIGHGSHTASIAAGNMVSHASMKGLAAGTARGGVPSARIAVYKVCWSGGCYDADILAAFDDAIADGVDIISISVGSNFVKDYFNNSISIGSFHSMKRGVLTSTSAGNSGPNLASITNFAPWQLSVAASTIDRKFIAELQLGSGETYRGISINTISTGRHPVIYARNAPNTRQGFNSSVSRYCRNNSLDAKLVKGKIVVCDLVGFTSSETVLSAGGVGAIMQDDNPKDFATSFPIPATHLGTKAGLKVSNYVMRKRKPTAMIFKSMMRKDKLAPVVGSFSSRGPNPITHDILKPDISAPGVDILAAWTQGSTVTGSLHDKRFLPYNIVSGTSMSCPHATGAAAFVKSFHRGWSPSAIKSALMTTASPMSRRTNKDAEFEYGSGHINPVKSVHPGLIYDMRESDYVQFLCGQGYTSTQMQIITGNRKLTCRNTPKRRVWDLNYPSFTMSVKPGKVVTRMFHRTVTNVGKPNSTYRVILKKPYALHIEVNPKVLHFNSVHETKSFIVTVRAKIGKSTLSGTLIWDDGKHQVRSPVVAYGL